MKDLAAFVEAAEWDFVCVNKLGYRLPRVFGGEGDLDWGVTELREQKDHICVGFFLRESLLFFREKLKGVCNAPPAPGERKW